MANTGNRGGLGFTEQQRGHDPNRPGSTTGTGQTSRQEEQGVLGTIKDKASELASGVGATAEQAWETTRNVASNVASTAEDAWDSVSSFMRRYPMATFFIGAGVGFLLAELFTGRSSSRSY
jgi:ElaB/YqjD/DUF883 family membrane-anchored ribosome-binding protein